MNPRHLAMGAALLAAAGLALFGDKTPDSGVAEAVERKPVAAGAPAAARAPEKTIATPRSSAAAMTSASRMLPPGWMTQPAPASTTTSRPSRNGKKASLATTVPERDSPACCALMPAMRAESRRLICPAPTPRVMPSGAERATSDMPMEPPAPARFSTTTA